MLERYRNPDDDLLFAETAEEAKLPREEVIRRQRRRRETRRRKTRRQAMRPRRPRIAPRARCLATPPSRIINKLTAYGPDHAKRQAIQQAGQLCPENIDYKAWNQLVNALESLGTGGGGRRLNPRQESISTLARRTLTKLRMSRSKAGLPVFRRNPRDEECYDKYWMNPYEDDDIFDVQTVLTFETGDDLSTEDANQLQEIVRMSLDWKGIARVMAKDMPRLAYMMERGLRKSHYDPAVQSALIEFLNILIRTADRRILVGRSNPEYARCGECHSSTTDHAEWCPLEHWEAATSKKTKKKLKKRRNPTTKKKKKYTCKKCGKNIKQKKRGRPKLSHSRCKAKR